MRGGIAGGRVLAVSPDITERDSLHGGPGADVVEGGVGRDVLRGDAGPDLLLARDRLYRDIVVCGLGRDRLEGDRADRAIGCERIVRR